MGTLRNSIHIQESQSPTPVNGPSPSISNNGFPILAIAVLCITATAFLLISYYILATKCCFRWQQFDPLRRLSFRRQTRNDDPLTAYSPSWQSRGLEELLIREIPTFLYSQNAENGILSKCVVCLNEFQEHDILKLLPKCNHVFHLDCVDVWLQSNANCPLCRSAISGRNRYRLDRIIAPNSSPQDPQPLSIAGSDEDFVVIELSRQQEGSGSSRNLVQSTHSSRKFDHKIGKPKPRKSHHVSIMGDEGIDVREKDDQFLIQPIRRSFSMDSAVDRHVYLSVQEIMQQNGQLFEVRNNEGQLFEVRNNEESSSSSRGYKSIFSFGHGRGSRNSVLPI